MRKLAVLLILAITVGSVSAVELEIDPIDRTASEDPAEFNLTIINENEESKEINPKVDARNSWLFQGLEPVDVDPSESKTQEFRVYRDQHLLQTNYGFEIYAYDNDTKFSVESYYSVEFEDDIIVSSTEMDNKELEGGESLSGSVEIRNTAQTLSSPVSLTVETPEAVEEFNLEQIQGGETETLDYDLEDPADSPGAHNLTIRLEEDGSELWETQKEFEIIEIEETRVFEESSNYILFSTTEKMVENTGNVDTEGSLEIEVPNHLDPITSVNPDPDSEEDETVVWTRNLSEGEEFSAGATTHYWIPVIAIITVIVVALIIQQNLSKVKVSKTTRDEGDKIKVHLEIENKAQKKFENLRLEDRIPEIADTMIDFPMGDPLVKKQGNGTKLVYKLEELDPGSQIVFEYTIDPRVEVEQEVKLPEAELKEDQETIASSGETSVKFNLPDVE